MKQRYGSLILSGMLVAAPAVVHGQGFGDVLDRLGDRMQRRAEDRVQQNADKAVDSVFDTTEGSVKSAAGGPDETTKPEPTAKNVAKCLATDTPCLSQAKARGQVVEILSEEEVDTLKCSTEDQACLKRAKQLGKKVELID